MKAVPEQHSLAQSVALHLAPGVIFTALLVPATSLLESRGIDPAFALFGGIGLVLVPLELGYLTWYARRTTGSWSPLASVDYRERLSAGRVALEAGGLALWFLICLAVSIAVVDQWLAEELFSWMPGTLLDFVAVEENGDEVANVEVVALAVVAFAFNGIAGPLTEELYFRGHLLPRLERFGAWAPVISTVLFAAYHFFSPWRYAAIIIGFMPITRRAWRERSVQVSIAAHMTINMVTVTLLVAAAFAQ
jgi:membrane protease YdiL (CAAX protease family)